MPLFIYYHKLQHCAVNNNKKETFIICEVYGRCQYIQSHFHPT